MRKLSLPLGLVLALAPGLAMAHPGAEHVHGAVEGFLHPFGGLDHVLAMVAVGIFAAQLGGRALWLVPAAFVGTMAAAGALGMSGVALPHVEIGIALSVVALGAAVALNLHIPTSIAAGLAGVFAIFHGYAHGAEMPASLSGLGYATGFICATAILHAIGIGLVVLLTRREWTASPVAVRVVGGVVAIAGAALLTGVA
ncbi:MAG TPA: HupE/UreJ family protein [Xanthobacteraceae bacterium]|nr:HupE/UreJ family protein [Xanthobacteraceae bacterium]